MLSLVVCNNSSSSSSNRGSNNPGSRVVVVWHSWLRKTCLHVLMVLQVSLTTGCLR